MRVEAHPHYWQIGRNGQIWPTAELASIHRDYLPRDFDRVRGAVDVQRSVLVQAWQNDAAGAWLQAHGATDRYFYI